MKKIFALLLAGMLVVSLAACSGNNTEESSTAESQTTTESSAESKAEESTEESADEKSEASETESKAEDTQSSAEDAGDTDKEAAEKISNIIGDKAGPKTAEAVKVLESNTLSAGFEMTYDQGDSETESSSTTAAMLSSGMKLSLVKNGEKASRINLDLGMMSMDILTIEDATYMINESEKTAVQFPKTDSSDSGSSLASMGMGGLVSTDDTGLKPDAITFVGSGEEEFNGETLSYEEYSIKANEESSAEENPLGEDMLSDLASKDSNLKIYFDSSNTPKYIYVVSGDSSATVTITSFSNEIDESQLKVPDDYTITEYGESQTTNE